MKPSRYLQHFRTLRFRLALLYLIVFGIIQTGLCLVILNARERYLREDFDQRLVDRAETMVEAISVRADQVTAIERRQRTEPRLNPFRFPGYYFQIRAAGGAIRERSRNLLKVSLPLSEPARESRSTGRPVLETIAGQATGLPVDGPQQLRLLTLYHDEPDVQPFILQVAAGLAPVEDSIAELRGLFFVLVPAGLFLAAVASWALARRSLAPIGEIARQAREYTAAHLDRRIRTRPGGDEAAELTRVVNGMLERLEAAFRAQERFIADASHELKTPLSVVLAEAQILLQQERTIEEYDQFVASIQDQLRQLVRLVDSLLTLARADAGFPLAQTQPVSVNEIVMEAVERCEPLARHREVRLVPVLAPPGEDGVEAIVSGDPSLLRAVVDNLLRNAIRYSPVEEAVEIEVRVGGDEVLVAVRDNGPGIPAEEIDRVFDRFFHIPRGEEAVQGAGLGLAIARGVATLHHGSISAANQLGGGCEFVLRLPLAAAGRAAD
ncbi:MAG: HAMP domain-containing histidine kinase [Planctomycetes bacterium]|nr:HAMP domain-containing histidine kinase [Planctomycetota bacterium]